MPGSIIISLFLAEGRQIGHVDIREDHTYVGLPAGMPDEVLAELQKTRVAGQLLRMARAGEVPPKPLRKPPKRGVGAPRKPASRKPARRGP